MHVTVALIGQNLKDQWRFNSDPNAKFWFKFLIWINILANQCLSILPLEFDQLDLGLNYLSKIGPRKSYWVVLTTGLLCCTTLLVIILTNVKTNNTHFIEVFHNILYLYSWMLHCTHNYVSCSNLWGACHSGLQINSVLLVPWSGSRG